MKPDVSLGALRLNGCRVIASLCVLMALISIATAAFLRPEDLLLTGIVSVLAGAAPVYLTLQKRTDLPALLTHAFGLPLYTFLMIYLFRGHPWQMDMHMLVFVDLAVITILFEWRAVLVVAALGAVHHLGLNFLAPEMVFYGSGGIGRVLVHAVIVVMEALVVAWLAMRMPGLLSDVAAQNELRVQAESAMAIEQAKAFDTQQSVVKELSKALSAIASGNLTASIDTPFPGEYENLRSNFNTTVSKLSSSISALGTGVEEMEQEFAAIARGSDDSASRNAVQAATLRETAEALEKMTVAMQEMLNIAAAMEREVATSEQLANEGNLVAQETHEAMAQAMEASTRINEIVELIEGIAFQTNLLALNAGVESARAGEAGAGFSVIAAEVRALSMRTSESVRNVRALTAESRERMEVGVSSVARSVVTLGSITQSVSAAKAKMEDMLSAVREQVSRFSQINSAVNELDQVNQQNAAMTEEVSTLSARMLESAGRLVERVQSYKTRSEALRLERASADIRTQHDRLRSSFS
jgi:methyl-accepting chemotaxis protein